MALAAERLQVVILIRAALMDWQDVIDFNARCHEAPAQTLLAQPAIPVQDAAPDLLPRVPGSFALCHLPHAQSNAPRDPEMARRL
jgi:hypothetical protein